MLLKECFSSDIFPAHQAHAEVAHKPSLLRSGEGFPWPAVSGVRRRHLEAGHLGLVFVGLEVWFTER